MQITQVTTAKGRREHVERHISRWLNSGIDELVLVDYACPESTGRWLLQHPIYGKDPRLTVLLVPKQAGIDPETKLPYTLAGDYFQLTKARNIGAVAAKHELLLFLDADCWVTQTFIEKIRTQAQTSIRIDTADEDGKPQKTRSKDPRANRLGPPDLWITGTNACDEELITSGDIPYGWVKDGQCVIRQHVFREINGYNEQHKEWGGECYDLYMRAVDFGARVVPLNAAQIYTLPHSDTLRTAHLPLGFDASGRESHFRRSCRTLKNQRRVERSNCGRAIGLGGKLSRYVRVFRGGVERSWRPGDDD